MYSLGPQEFVYMLNMGILKSFSICGTTLSQCWLQHDVFRGHNKCHHYLVPFLRYILMEWKLLCTICRLPLALLILIPMEHIFMEKKKTKRASGFQPITTLITHSKECEKQIRFKVGQ